jgi:cytochrome c biogenesis protein CcdA/thiol-disulfide isomerase/thioredoxin
MALLMVFALIAGAGTALSPCVLPILPAVLSAGVTGGRRRPLGVATGLALSFTFATVALVYVIDALGLPDDIARTIAIVVLFGFGFSLLVPAVGDRIEAFASRIAPGPARFRGDGFGSGLVVGASLGLVYAPCAGPILAGVITVSAAQDFTAGKLAVAFAYAVGSAAVIYALLLGGRRLADRLAPIRGRVQMAMGAVMVCVAALMVADVDTRFQTAIADDLPAFLVNPTNGIETSDAVSKQIVAVKGGGKPILDPSELDDPVQLRLGPQAPEFTDNQEWFNTPGGDGLTMSGLRADHQVVLIDFWTYTCINCIRTLPYLEAWDRRYGDEGLTIVGVHSPEFPFEKDAGNVADAIRQNGLTYPVVQDNDLGTWDAWGNQYWPADYLVDSSGFVRSVHFGEGGYDDTEKAIRALLREAGHDDLGAGARASGETASKTATTPETYLGSSRARGWTQDPITSGERDFGTPPGTLKRDAFAYSGNWDVGDESATAGTGAGIDVEFNARRVFLVLGSPDEPRQVQVLLDGKPIPNDLAGDDVHNGRATIDAQRLYRLVDLPAVGRHRLSLRFDDGVEGYAFTFG